MKKTLTSRCLPLLPFNAILDDGAVFRMKQRCTEKITVAVLTLLLSLTAIATWGQEQQVSEKVYFEGGIRKLTGYLHKESSSLTDSIKDSHFIFYKLTLNKGSGIRAVELLNTRCDYITSKLEEIISREAEKWKNRTNEYQTVILPVFFQG